MLSVASAVQTTYPIRTINTYATHLYDTVLRDFHNIILLVLVDVFFYSLFTGDGHHRHIRIKCIEFECLLRSMNVHVRNILYAVFVSFHSIFHNPNW